MTYCLADQRTWVTVPCMWNEALCRKVHSLGGHVVGAKLFLHNVKQAAAAQLGSACMTAAQECLVSSLNLPLLERRSDSLIVKIADYKLASSMIEWLDGLFQHGQSDLCAVKLLRPKVAVRDPGIADQKNVKPNRFALKAVNARSSSCLQVALMRACRRALVLLLDPVRARSIHTLLCGVCTMSSCGVSSHSRGFSSSVGGPWRSTTLPATRPCSKTVLCGIAVLCVTPFFFFFLA